MKLRQVRTSFNAGELTSLLTRRTDIDAYQNGAERVRNMRILPTGGLRRRPGTQLLHPITAGPYQAEDFTFDLTQAYVLLFRAGAVDIYSAPDGAFLLTVVGPWTAAMLGHMSVAQQGDSMFITHEDLQTQILKRTGAASFTLAAMAFDVGIAGTNNAPAQPYYKFLPPSSSLVIQFVSYSDGNTTFDWPRGYTSGTNINILSSHALFTASHVGAFLKFASGYIQVTGVTNSTTAVGVVQSNQIYIELPSNPIRTWQGSSWVVFSDPFHGNSVLTNVFISGAAAVGATPSTQLNGQREIVSQDVGTWAINTATVATETIYGGGDGVRYWSNAMRSREWQEPAWSATRGWPRSVTFDDQRLIFGGSKSLPNRLFASRVDAPFNFDVGTGKDNESIQAGIASQRVAIIHAVVSFRHLQIFTSEGEYYCPGSDNKPLSPATISFKRQSQYGIGSIPPVEFDGSTIFVTRTNAVRELLFNADDSAYNSPSLSMLAQHLMTFRSATGIAVVPLRLESQIETATEQETVAFVVRSDGRMAVLTFSRKEKILGWGLWQTEGAIRDIVSCNRRLFVITERAGQWYLEIGSGTDFQLDCASFFSQPVETTVWAGLTDYAGRQVRLIGPGREDLGNAIVDPTGIVITPKPVNTLQVGFPFEWEVKTLPPELNMQDGPSLGQPRRIVRSRIDVEDTFGAVSNGTHVELKRIEDANFPARPANGGLEFWHLGWDDLGQLTVTCPENVPVTIKSVLLELEF